MLKVNELFSGIGAQSAALKRLEIDFEVVATADTDKDALVSYAALNCKVPTEYEYPAATYMADYLAERNIGYDFKKNKPYDWHRLISKKTGKASERLKKYYLSCIISKNRGDVSKIEKLDYADFWTYSFPCFTKDNYVLTDKGYKTIDKIKIGDKVLTHNNTYEKVVNVFNNGIRDTVKVKGQCIDEIITTKNHKFYVREKYRRWNNERRSHDRLFKDPEWLGVDKVTKDYYLGVAINQNSIIPKWDGVDFEWSDGRKARHKNELQPLMTNKRFWWLIGRYIADGWTRTQHGIVIAIGKHKLDEFIANIGDIFNYNIVEERTSYKCHIPTKELEKFVLQFGEGAINKKITNTIIDLPVDLLESFLDGYISGDGYYNKGDGRYKCSSISRELLIGLGQCVAKVYRTPFCLYKTKRPKKTKIEGRIVNQQNSYELTFKKDVRKQDNAFYENGYIWYPFQSIEDNGKEEVFDIEVENVHSFTVQNTIVHNCQDISVAGKQAGIEKHTRSGLLYEVERLLNVSAEHGELPKYLMLENVKNLVGKKFKAQFEEWLQTLDELGYNNYWKVLNAKRYGIPQNRERVFGISIRKDVDTGDFTFPEGFDNGLRLKDFLEDEVDEKFYISNEKTEKLIKQLDFKNKDLQGIDLTINQTLTTVQKDNMLLEPKIVCEQRTDEGLRFFKDGCVGTLRTIDACGDKRVLVKEATKQGYAIAEEGDSINIQFPNSDTRRGRVGKECAQTLETSCNQATLTHDYRIRKLTPKECWRLMGFTDEEFQKAQDAGVSNSQLYKQAGNSIVVDVLEYIFRNLLKQF